MQRVPKPKWLPIVYMRARLLAPSPPPQGRVWDPSPPPVDVEWWCVGMEFWCVGVEWCCVGLVQFNFMLVFATCIYLLFLSMLIVFS